MDLQKVIDILYAHYMCSVLDARYLLGNDFACDKNCDGCEWLYRKGTRGESIDAFRIAADILVKLQDAPEINCF